MSTNLPDIAFEKSYMIMCVKAHCVCNILRLYIPKDGVEGEGFLGGMGISEKLPKDCINTFQD